MIGRRESCDIVLRFANVSAHHCQLLIDGGYWYVRDMQSRNGIKVNDVRVQEQKRIDPGDMLAIAKHKYRVEYDPVELGAVGPPPADNLSQEIMNESLLARAGLDHREIDRAAARRRDRRRPALRPDEHEGRPDRAAGRPGVRAGAGAESRESEVRFVLTRLLRAPLLLMAKKKRKLRTDFRKNREVRARDKRLQPRAGRIGFAVDAPHGERVSGKGDISRKRTVAGAEIVEDEAGTHVLPDVDRTVCRLGRVLRVQGLLSIVRDEAGAMFQCATRRLLKTLATDQRHVVAAGDIVWFRPEGESEGIIERVEPRHGVVSRTSRGRQHVLVANVDQLVIVTSAAEPRLKPNLIDRLLVTAEKGGIRPIICINKIDLIEPADLMPLVGVYAQLGYDVLLVSATTGIGIDRLRERLAGAESVVTGQSGVGKSSLLNAVEPGLASARADGQRGNAKRAAHDDDRRADSALVRRLRRRYARHPPVPTVGRDPGRSRRLLPRPAAVRQPLPLSRLHAHARRRLRGERRRRRRLDRRPALRELRANPLGRRGVIGTIAAGLCRIPGAEGCNVLARRFGRS